MSEALRLAELLDENLQGYEENEAAAAELRRLHAENERLTKCITYEQHRAERIGTHGPGCHTWGPQHYECAKRLNAELVEALRGLSDEVERFGLHHPDGNSNWWPVTLEKAQAALAKVEASK